MLYSSFTKRHFMHLIVLLFCFVPFITPSDPYYNMQYADMFNQDALWKKYHALMKKMGNASNIFGKDSQQHHDPVCVHTQEQIYDHKELRTYQRECMKLVNDARNNTLAEPGIYALTEMGALITGSTIVNCMFDSASMGGSFSGFVAVFESLRCVKDVIKAAKNMLYKPNNILAHYEENFAKNKCFIPRALWPRIVREFISARQNDFTREQHMHFLHFALGFTTYKPKPKIETKDHLSIDEIKLVLREKITLFFSQYKDAQSLKELHYITLNVEKFIDQLYYNKESTTPRYIYLYGPGGVGKTYFVEQLITWIEEVLPNIVNFENIIINDAQELEGHETRPGTFLKVLHNQLVQNKRGSVLLFDEATWLNQFTTAAKRTFNLDQSRIITTYFGNGPEGAGIPIDAPPMLIFVASNEQIVDEALASRFDIINYPEPTHEALLAHALRSIQASNAIKRSQINITPETLQAWIEQLDEKKQNFRYIAGSVEVEFLR